MKNALKIVFDILEDFEIKLELRKMGTNLSHISMEQIDCNLIYFWDKSIEDVFPIEPKAFQEFEANQINTYSFFMDRLNGPVCVQKFVFQLWERTVGIDKIFNVLKTNKIG